MKERIKYIKLCTWLAMALILTTTSCRDDTFAEYFNNSDEYTVTLNIGLEGMSATTRTGDDNDTSDEEPGSISSGSQIDMLVYAVYYDDAVDKDTPGHIPDWKAATEYAKAESPFKNKEVGYGQTIVDVGDKFKGKKKEFHTMTLTLKKGLDYRVVFWAQNSESEAYVIEDLKKVQMKYKIEENANNGGKDTPAQVDTEGMGTGSSSGESSSESGGSSKILSVNNDEGRDAFCRYIHLTADEVNNNSITVYLRRPLAQINVGTRGFDFETITRNSDKKYIYSKVRIDRAARYLNVVEDKIYVRTDTVGDQSYTGKGDTESFYTVDYEYSLIPAYWKTINPQKPNYPSYTIYDYYYSKDQGDDYKELKTMISKLNPDAVSKENWDKTLEGFQKYYGREEFLKVHLFEGEDSPHDPNTSEVKKKEYMPEDKEGYCTYARMGLTGSEENNLESEVFKYLSMSYILVPTNIEGQSYTLNNFKMWLATDENGENEFEVLSLNNVPVQRNHRTNIVGSLLTSKANVQVVVDEDFAGNKISGDNVVSGEIHEGFYYNAQKNEFEISSREGLLFFQRLVNGSMGVRQINGPDQIDGKKVTLGGNYPYMAYESNSIYWLENNPVTYEELGKQKAQILLKGTGLTDYTDNGSGNFLLSTVTGADGKNHAIRVQMDKTKDGVYWPRYNNFSFYGCTVRLMADIDMSGVEWIPIGFDCCMWDSSIGKDQAFKAEQQYTATNYRSFMSISNATAVYLDHRRVFCGTFDGNNHTIYNLKTKRFGAQVLDYNQQNTNNGPYDNVQWFGRGLFGLGGPGVVIKNIRLQNVDIHGNNGVAGIIAVVNSPYFHAKIENCVVEGGTITAVPLYRNDYNYSETRYYGRTHARGVYVGGIVGQFSAYGNDIGIENCEVRNLTISGFRRMGGIIGSIADQGSSGMGDARYQLDVTVENNTVANTLIVCNQYTPFNYFWNHIDNNVTPNTYKNGFGWGASSSFSPMSDVIAGGLLEGVLDSNGKEISWGTYTAGYTNKKGITKTSFYEEYVPKKNSQYNVQYSILSVRPNEGGVSTLLKSPVGTARECTVGNIPLEWIPMFSSMYVDEISLTDNYSGTSKLKTQIDFTDAILWAGSNRYFHFPITFPNGGEINYMSNAPTAGMYVESVYLTGQDGLDRRVVITPSGVQDEHSCVMYVTARDRKQFENVLSGQNNSTNTTGKKLNEKTTIKNVVLRGSPYGWAGILFAPNANMSSVELDSVTIYDVYQTLALQDVKTTLDMQTLQNYTYWNDYHYNGTTMVADATLAKIPLDIKNCNLRGYTFPGKGWSKITYSNTTFEQGAETAYSTHNSTPIHTLYYPDKENGTVEMEDIFGTKQLCSLAAMQRYKVCRIDAPTEFNNCKFKAPFFIDLSHLSDETKVTFENCMATSTYKSVYIKFDDKDERTRKGKKVYFIEVFSDTHTGETVIRYYGMKDGDSPSEKNYNKGYFIDEDRE